MNESMREYMKVGLIHFMAFPETAGGEGPILETLRSIILDPYFDAVEVTWIKDPDVRREAARMLAASQMAVGYGAHPCLLSTGLNLNHLDEKERGKAIAAMKEGIDQAYELGATGFVFLSGKYEEAKQEQALAALVDSTRQLCAYAQTKGGLKIIHEMFDHKVDKKSLIGPAALARRYAELISKEFDNFGLLVDLSHIPLIGESPAEAILPVRKYLVHAHLGNCIKADPARPGYGDTHPRFGCPGGENDAPQVADFLRVLLETGFLNKAHPPMVSFEVKPRPDEDPGMVIANAKSTLTQAWAML
jgi:sugar phosphate isomerase/epimerase